MNKVQEYIDFYKKHNRHPVMNKGKDERRLRQWGMQIVCYARYDGYNTEKEQVKLLKDAGITDIDTIALSRQLSVLNELIKFWEDTNRIPRQSSDSNELEQRLARWRLNKIFKRSPDLDAVIKEKQVEFLFDTKFGIHAQSRAANQIKSDKIKSERIDLFTKFSLQYTDNQVYYNQLIKLDQFIDFVKKHGRVPRCYDTNKNDATLYSWWRNKINARYTDNEESRAKWNPEFVQCLKNAGLPDLFKQVSEIPVKYIPRRPKQ